MDFAGLLALTGIFVIGVVATIMLIKNILYVCQPNEVLVFSGRARAADGRTLGYRIIKGGRAIRVPLIETVDRMDLTNMIIELQVRGAYSKGGIPLTVQGVANLKVPGEEPLIHASLERFLGKSRGEIMKVARETLEGNLRGVMATLTPEQVNQDKEAFAQKLTEEAEHDMTNIGLVLDTLKIQNVSDDVGYLDAIGRMRSAEIRKRAQVAEAQARAEAEIQKWRNTREAELAKLDARIQVAIKDNERRIGDATTRREAMIAEERAEVQAQIAQSTAEIGMQEARIEQVRRQLRADVLEPAEAARKKAEEDAKAAAAEIIEQGRATAEVLGSLASTYRGSGTSGRDVLLMQKLVPMLRRVSGTIGDIRVDKLTVIGGGAGNGKGDLATSLVHTNEQIKAATGVDIPKLITDRFGGGTPARE
ncbi:MAG: flotillin family protein [Sandaracinaceae bacterium]|nr:flotillin family protein [Sandaracinaceae bacterium]